MIFKSKLPLKGARRTLEKFAFLPVRLNEYDDRSDIIWLVKYTEYQFYDNALKWIISGRVVHE